MTNQSGIRWNSSARMAFWRPSFSFKILWRIPLLFVAATALAAEPPEQFFEAKIRPLLIDRCITCHSGNEPDGGLSLESKEGWADREVITPGDPEHSLLITAVRYQDASLQMPPADSDVDRLSENEIQLLERWIREGAVDPRSSQGTETGPRLRARKFKITQHDINHWAYQPIRDPSLKYVDQEPSQVIDRLIDKKLQPMGVIRSSQATPRELVRRAYFDLWGLPPDPEAVMAFQRDPSDAAWSALIDKLLASPHYGERWGRYWLDWVRYAETNGYERDGNKANAWRYRDYVIESFNHDKPYDRYLIEQLAGDLLIADEQLTLEQTPDRWKDAVIATGFYRLHIWDDEPDDTEAAELDDLDDIMVTTGAAMMGMTTGCNRCHDHKFDPFSQVDYYSMLDLFRDIDPYGLSKKGGGGRGTGRISSFLCSEQVINSWRAEQQQKIEAIEKKIATAGDSEKNTLQEQLKQLKDEQPPYDQTLAVNPPAHPRKATYVLARGDYQSPQQQVFAAIPQLFDTLSKGRSQIAPQADQAQQQVTASVTHTPVRNRIDFARWLTAPHHPLTARVLANRVWQNHFGAGIVPTPDDFGYTGIAPKNEELLDPLATQFQRGGWSIKNLHRVIMNSQAYRMSSQARPEGNSAALDHDPDNSLFWRQNLRRLDAEAIRDSMLAYSGELTDKASGPSVYTTLSAEILETANPVSVSTWSTSPDDQQNCRSVFLVVKRSLKDPLLESFDFANSHTPVGQRPVTTVAPQALMLLNDRFVQQRSEKIAQRLIEQTTETESPIERLWQLIYQRASTQPEQTAVTEFLQKQSAAARTEHSAWTSVVRSILNSNESIHVE
ncbi:MAG: PSD1 and planctomycete cytochrome C domain-containing protein [Planctomycetota bacterium]|nr:PSD1 and planctomycete cytochrome C domain-containing protein [Planctomycetota bacterium]